MEKSEQINELAGALTKAQGMMKGAFYTRKLVSGTTKHIPATAGRTTSKAGN